MIDKEKKLMLALGQRVIAREALRERSADRG